MKYFYQWLLLVVLALPTYSFSQDLSCEFIITLEQIDDQKYDYRLIVEHQYSKESIATVQQQLETNWQHAYAQHVKSAILQSGTEGKMLVGYTGGYCYPTYGDEQQLRLIIARKERATNTVELLYTTCKLMPNTTEFFVRNFKAGKRDSEVYTYHKIYTVDKHIDFSHIQRAALDATKIYVN
jgi:hypothetical protein